jgi:SAM-dependent methyltransferase
MSGAPNATADTEDFEFAALERAENYRKAVLREFSEWLRGDVLEIGAGIGQFTAPLSRLPGVKQVTALEPEARFAKEFRRLHPEIALVEGTIAAAPARTDWDAMLSINVLEHIDADEAELGIYARKLSARRGHLCLFVPARPELQAPIDMAFGHFRRYKHPELKRKMERAGFEIVRLEYFNLVGYFAWWWSFCVLKRNHFDAGSVAIFDRYIFPWTHAIEAHVMRPPFGQSLLAVGRAK